MFQVRRRAVPFLAGLLTLSVFVWSAGSAVAGTSKGDPDTAHRANAKQMIVTVSRSHQVHVQGNLYTTNGTRMRADSSSGGGGLGSSAPTTTSKPRSKKSVTTSSADPLDASDPVLAPVEQNGQSLHLGNRTLKEGMSGHDVRVLQGYLTVAGYPTTIDGNFGSTTLTNVIKFEQASQLDANGVMTYAQSRVLRQAVATAIAGGAVSKATINPDGTATAPASAPPVVQEMVAAANQIVNTSYCYAGGHGSWTSSCYDCSGSVSFALHGGNLLSSPEDSTGLESYGSPGPGKWVTIYADAEHTWIVIAGIAFDTAHYGATTPGGTGPRWLSNPTGNLADGGDYTVRHPTGL